MVFSDPIVLTQRTGFRKDQNIVRTEISGREIKKTFDGVLPIDDQADPDHPIVYPQRLWHAEIPVFPQLAVVPDTEDVLEGYIGNTLWYLKVKFIGGMYRSA